MKTTKIFFLITLACLAVAGGQNAQAGTIAVTSTADSGPGSLRNALVLANNGDTINITAKGTITLTSGELVVAKSVTIHGPGAAKLSVSGNSASRVFHVTPNTIVTISALTITNGSASSDLGNFPANAGGGIYSDHAKLTISDCTLTANSAALGGGILSNVENGNDGSLTVKNTTFSHNAATYGGGIFNDGESGNARMTLTNSIFTGNSATVLGGGIYNDGEFGNTTNIIINCQFIANAAATDPGTHFFRGGAGIFNDGYSGSAVLSIDGSVFRENNGGHDFVFGFGPSLSSAAIWNHGYYGNAVLSMNNCDLDHNSTQPGFVGGIFNYGEGGTATMTLANSTIRNHECGGITNEAATATIKNCIISGNTGGITNSGSLSLTKSTVSDNSADGGIANEGGHLTGTDSTISDNSADAGGGIWMPIGGTLTLTNCTISGNSASYAGGIYAQTVGNDGTVILTNCTVSGNTASVNANAIANQSYAGPGAAVLILNNDTFTDNLGGTIAVFNVTTDPTQGSATTEISNCILNTQGITGSIGNQDGTLISHGYNLSSDRADGDAGTSPGGLLNGPGDIRNTDPLLGPLQNNGGPTMTHALLVHSPAINAGDPNFNPYAFNPPLIYDQRDGPGFPRVVNGRVDIGAFESRHLHP